MTGSDIMKKGGRLRCNYYRITSLVVMLFLIVCIYWAMFSSASSVDEKRTFANGKLRNVVDNFKMPERFRDKKLNEFGNLKQLGDTDRLGRPDDIDFESKDRIRNGGKSQQDDGQHMAFEDPIRPFDEQDQPSEGQQNGGQQNGGQSHQSEGQNRPFEGQGRPSEGQGQPSEGQGRPSEGQGRPSESQSQQNRNQGQQNQVSTNEKSPAWNLPNSAGQGTLMKSVLDASINQINNRNSNQNVYGQNERWIVLTTIQGPTDDVKFLSKLEGWNIVICGDTKTPADWSYGNVHYLSVEAQLALGFETVSLLNTKSYSRKNAGYLYALQKGAKIIYETDDDNRPLDLLKNFIYEKQTTGLKYVGGKIFNPYRHFGQPTLWPRGFPLGFIAINYTDNYELGLIKTPSVQQGVVNGDPDMGAMFRLTRKRTKELLNVSFDNEVPFAVLPPGVLAPYNSQNTLFTYDVLWSLILPQTVTFRICDIWRGYWAQRLMWEIGATLGFFGPNAFQKRNSHSYVSDAIQEKDLYFKTHDLYDFLLSWTCPTDLTFFQCAIKLTEDMEPKDFWRIGDVKMIKAWFRDLKKLGYQEPKRVPFTMLEPKQPSNSQGVSQVSFTAKEMDPHMYYDSKYIMVDQYWNRVQKVTEICSPLSYQVSAKSLKQPTHSDVVLIVAFKNTNYEIIPMLNVLYGSKFPHIVFCGSDFAMYESTAKSFNEPVTFVTANTNRGYNCISAVMKMMYKVNGFMLIGSETLLNPWQIDNMDKSKIWFDHSKLLKVVSRSAQTLATWNGWESEYGSRALNKAWEKLSSNNENPSLAASFEKKFQLTLQQNTNSKDSVYVGPSDVVYIPISFRDSFLMYVDAFSQFKVYHEIVIPTVISGLDQINNMLPLNGKYLWTENEKENYAQSFSPDIAFLHPVDIGKEMRTNKGASFICNSYLPLIVGGKISSRQSQSSFRRFGGN